MRKKDKEITDFSKIEKIIRTAAIYRLGMSDDGMPYIVPLNF